MTTATTTAWLVQKVVKGNSSHYRVVEVESKSDKHNTTLVLCTRMMSMHGGGRAAWGEQPR